MTSLLTQLSTTDRSRLEQLLLDFDRNWTEHHLGIIAGQLSSETHEFRTAALTELSKIDLEYRQQRGDKIGVEFYQDRFPELRESDAAVMHLLEAEIELRHHAGDSPTGEELKERFPQLAEHVESMLAAATESSEHSRLRRAKRQPATGESGVTSIGSTASIASADRETLPPASRRPGPSPPQESGPQDQFGRYRLVKELGRGAMGTVYLAEDTELRRQVALKRPRIAGSEEASMMERFYREAYAAATLDHPNICPVYDIGTHEGVPFITMAFVEGKPLSKVIRESSGLNPRAVAVLVRKIAVALAEAHEKGVIHRDLKPGNIMLNHRNEPVVMDFGLARQVEHADDRLTADGTLIGTPGYMSPEQVEGDLNAVGRPSDIYSLGVVLFELLTGELPYRGSVTSVIGQILRDETPAPSSLRAELPEELDKLCLKMLAKSPGDRHANMSEVAQALGAFIKSSGDSPSVVSPPQIEQLTPARLEAQKNQITQVIAGGQWREASLQLQRMSELTEPFAAPYVQWSREQSTALHARWQQEQQAAERTLSTAKEQFSRQDYSGAAQTLLTVDKQLLTADGKQLLDSSLKLQEDVDLLVHLIEEGLRTGKQRGMVKNLQRLLQLKPKDPLARDLYRKYRWQQRLGWFGTMLADAVSLAIPCRTRSWFDEPLLRKWFALATLVGLTSFGLMSWAVVIYLKRNGRTTATVTIAGDALERSDLEITIAETDAEKVSAKATDDRVVDPEKAPAMVPEQPNLPSLDRPAPLDTSGLVKTLPAYRDGINDVQTSPDGRYIAVAVDAQEVVLWDNRSGQVVQAVSDRPLGNVRSLLWSSDGSTLLAAGDTISRIAMRDLRSVVITVPRLVEHVVWLSGGNRFVAFARDGLYVYDAGSLESVSISTDVVAAGRQCFDVNSDGTHILFSDSKHELSFFDLSSQTVESLDLVSKDRPIQIRFVPDREDLVLVAGEAGMLDLYDLKERRLVRSLVGHRENVSSLDVLSDGRFAVSGSPDDTIRVWHLDSGAEVHRFRGSRWCTARIDISPDEHYVISGGGKRHGPGGRGANVMRDNAVHLWRLPPEEELERRAREAGAD
ncbi:MAG: protein kinase [Planctomycetes bacterium]|nr:protein kinase [Planctomycetota bacterium]